jgi:hypothetical protein
VLELLRKLDVSYAQRITATELSLDAGSVTPVEYQLFFHYLIDTQPSRDLDCDAMVLLIVTHKKYAEIVLAFTGNYFIMTEYIFPAFLFETA